MIHVLFLLPPCILLDECMFPNRYSFSAALCLGNFMSVGFGLLCEMREFCEFLLAAWVRIHAGLQLHRCDSVSIGARYLFSFQNSCKVV